MTQDTTFIATLHTSQGDFKTGEDSQIGFEVSNLAGEGRDSLVGQEVELRATGRRVWDIRKA